MSFQVLKDLISEFPRDVDAFYRLDSLLSGERNDDAYFTLRDLYDTANFSSQYVFNCAIDRLIKNNVLEKIVRIQTINGGIEDYKDIEDVPEEVFDWRSGMNIRVKPELIKVLFKLEH